MPDMDGYEFVEIIKSHPDTVFIPLFVTAISNEQKYLSKTYDLGAIDFFKPLNTEITRKKSIFSQNLGLRSRAKKTK
jgi:response regulator RpfG family c-di-GMP phosphodiesterase